MTMTNYQPKTYDEIFLSLVQNAISSGLLSDDMDFINHLDNLTDIENNIILEYSVHALQYVGQYEDLTTIYNAFNLNLAVGVDLDIIGLMLGTARRPANYAVTQVNITLSNAQIQNIVIPAGSVINSASQSNLFFTTLTDVTIYAGQTTISVNVICSIVGPQGNVPAHDLTSLQGVQNYIFTLDNPYRATGGVNVELDEPYRQRLLNAMSANVEGTYDCIVSAVGDIPTVTGYYIDPFWDGYGSTLIVIDPPLDLVINDVAQVIDEVKAVDEYIRVVPVETVPINLIIIANVSIDSTIEMSDDQKNTLALSIQSDIADYVNGGTLEDGTEIPELGIGNDFIPFQMERYVGNCELQVKNIETTFPTDPITIDSNQKAILGSVSVTVV